MTADDEDLDEEPDADVFERLLAAPATGVGVLASSPSDHKPVVAVLHAPAAASVSTSESVGTSQPDQQHSVRVRALEPELAEVDQQSLAEPVRHASRAPSGRPPQVGPFEQDGCCQPSPSGARPRDCDRSSGRTSAQRPTRGPIAEDELNDLRRAALPKRRKAAPASVSGPLITDRSASLLPARSHACQDKLSAAAGAADSAGFIPAPVLSSPAAAAAASADVRAGTGRATMTALASLPDLLNRRSAAAARQAQLQLQHAMAGRAMYPAQPGVRTKPTPIVSLPTAAPTRLGRAFSAGFAVPALAVVAMASQRTSVAKAVLQRGKQAAAPGGRGGSRGVVPRCQARQSMSAEHAILPRRPFGQAHRLAGGGFR